MQLHNHPSIFDTLTEFVYVKLSQICRLAR